MKKFTSEDAYRIHYIMMSLTGAWPINNRTFLYRIKNILISWAPPMFITTAMLMKIYFDLGDIAKVSKTLFVMISLIEYLFKMAIFTVKEKSFVEMLENLKRPIFEDHPIELNVSIRKNARLSIRVTKMFREICALTIFLFAIFPVLDRNPEEPLPLPFPYKIKSNPYIFYPTYVLQIAGLGITAWNNSCLDTLACTLMALGTGQLEILKSNLMHATDIPKDSTGEEDKMTKYDDLIIERLEKCMEHHMEIVKYIAQIENVFTQGFLAQLMASLILVCMTGFNLIIVPLSLQYAMVVSYFAVIMMQLAMYCWFGNHVIVQSSTVTEACYMCDWPTCSNRVRKVLFIIMEYSKRPLQLTAGKFIILSLSSYASIMKSSYSYFAVLQRLYREK